MTAPSPISSPVLGRLAEQRALALDRNVGCSRITATSMSFQTMKRDLGLARRPSLYSNISRQADTEVRSTSPCLRPPGRPPAAIEREQARGICRQPTQSAAPLAGHDRSHARRDHPGRPMLQRPGIPGHRSRPPTPRCSPSSIPAERRSGNSQPPPGSSSPKPLGDIGGRRGRDARVLLRHCRATRGRVQPVRPKTPSISVPFP